MQNVKIKRVVVTKPEYWEQTKKWLNDNGKSYLFITEGNTSRIQYGEKEFVYIDTKSIGSQGHHINKYFMDDIDQWLLKYGDSLAAYPQNYQEQIFNINSIEGCIGEQLVMIDINDCYWMTARRLGYITEQTFIKGLKLKQWKIGRNACIGSLAKTTVITPFIDGVASRLRRQVLRPDPKRQYIRNHIIGEVYELFTQIISEIQDDFFMFLTDCIVTRYSRLKDVQAHLTIRGYKFKHKPMEFREVDRRAKKITWYDYQSSVFDTRFDRETKQGKTKYYHYSPAQIVLPSIVKSDNDKKQYNHKKVQDLSNKSVEN